MHIAITSQAFGFGPASKAWTISTAARSRGHRVTAFGESTAADFFRTNGHSIVEQHPRHDDHGTIAARLNDADVLIVVLDHEWVNFAHGRLPTVFVDSIGFMWGAPFFEANPALLNVDAYCVQDAFDAPSHIASLGVHHVRPVGAIIETTSASKLAPTGDTVVHLGGLMNIFSSTAGPTYANWVLGQVDQVTRLHDTPVLTSGLASEALDARFNVIAADHPSAIARFAAAAVVITSPGLTTLLELAQLAKPVAFLPPQNMSQALIVTNLVRIGAPHATLAFYAERYRLPDQISEEEGVARVSDLNARYHVDSDFHEGLREALKADLDRRQAIPTICTSTRGAQEILTIAEGFVPARPH